MEHFVIGILSKTGERVLQGLFTQGMEYLDFRIRICNHVILLI